MARLRFLVDYRGVLTDERFYRAGVEVDDSDIPNAPALVESGRAEYVQVATKQTYTRKPRTKAVKNET